MENASSLIYTAQSKREFYCRDAVCEFVFRAGAVPLHPFRMFDYFLGERVHRDAVRSANRRVLQMCDEVWVFGTHLADGVLVEIEQALVAGKGVRHFTISSLVDEIRPAQTHELQLEPEVALRTGISDSDFEGLLLGSRTRHVVEALGRTSELSV